LENDAWALVLFAEEPKSMRRLFNKRGFLENLRYYSTPEIFLIHVRFYINPRDFSNYIHSKVYGWRNHI
jgi:hypothetical protein